MILYDIIGESIVMGAAVIFMVVGYVFAPLLKVR